MDAFEYLSVLLSIILGLAITPVLQGYRGLLLSRATVTAYFPAIIWSVLMLAFATQSWWASFGLSDHTGWTFASFSLLLLQTILLYMMTALVLPDFPTGEAVDLRTHFYRERLPFFGISLAMIASSIGKEWMLEGRLPEGRNLTFHLLFASVSLAAMLIKRPRFHEVTAPVMAIFVTAYIALLFARL